MDFLVALEAMTAVEEAVEITQAVVQESVESALEAVEHLPPEALDISEKTGENVLSKAVLEDLETLEDHQMVENGSSIRGMVGENVVEANGEEPMRELATQEFRRELQDRIKEETNWSETIVSSIETQEQYEIYKNAGLREAEVNGRKCLLRDIDLDYIDEKTGKTNLELMEKGRCPIDKNTGETIELHHMGQGPDSPFAELTENTEHGDGNDAILHDKSKPSWRHDPVLKNRYTNIDKPYHWKARAKGVI